MTEVRKTERVRRSGFGEIPCVQVVREVLNIINKVPVCSRNYCVNSVI
jgi:hypothetical protein